MDRLPAMVDMSVSGEDEAREAVSIGRLLPSAPRYPYGLSICLTQNELEKLDVDYSDWKVGDHFHLMALAKITGISETETEKGKNCRVEMQIIALSGEDEELEGEAEENEGEEISSKSYQKMYK